jgi:hypothetical protein
MNLLTNILVKRSTSMKETGGLNIGLKWGRLSGLEMDERSSGFSLVAAFVVSCVGFSCSANEESDKRLFKSPRLHDRRYFYRDSQKLIKGRPINAVQTHTCPSNKGNCKCKRKVNPRLNKLGTTPYRRMEEWSGNSTILDLKVEVSGLLYACKVLLLGN